jgi:hypothetical protein
MGLMSASMSPPCRAFAGRFVDRGVQFEIEDILVNGPPWNLRVAVRAHDFVPCTGGEDDQYNNRAVAFLELKWGRLVRWEDYEDSERVAAWDARRATDSAANRLLADESSNGHESTETVPNYREAGT